MPAPFIELASSPRMAFPSSLTWTLKARAAFSLPTTAVRDNIHHSHLPPPLPAPLDLPRFLWFWSFWGQKSQCLVTSQAVSVPPLTQHMRTIKWCWPVALHPHKRVLQEPALHTVPVVVQTGKAIRKSLFCLQLQQRYTWEYPHMLF